MSRKGTPRAFVRDTLAAAPSRAEIDAAMAEGAGRRPTAAGRWAPLTAVRSRPR